MAISTEQRLNSTNFSQVPNSTDGEIKYVDGYKPGMKDKLLAIY